MVTLLRGVLLLRGRVLLLLRRIVLLVLLRVLRLLVLLRRGILAVAVLLRRGLLSVARTRRGILAVAAILRGRGRRLSSAVALAGVSVRHGVAALRKWNCVSGEDGRERVRAREAVG